MKRFACIWLPTFQIDRMRREQPQWVPKDKPLALVENGPRGVAITAVNKRATAGGVCPEQMLADARAILPDLLTRPSEPDRDTHALQQLALWIGRYGPQRNVDGPDGLWVDITGVAHLYGGEEALARDCVRRLRRAGYHGLIAIADTRSGAYALARYGRMHKQIAIAPPGAIRSALTDLPVEGLQLTRDLAILLRRLGLKRIGQLYPLPRSALTRRFRDAAPKIAKGRKAKRGLGNVRGNVRKPAAAHVGGAEALVMRLDQALGDLSEPERGIIEPPVYRAQRAYAEPLISHDGILAALDDLAANLCVTLDEKEEGARALRFSIYRADGSVAEMIVRTSRPARETRHIVHLFNERLERVDAGLGIDAVVLEAMCTERLAQGQVGFAGSTDRRNDSAELIDRLSNRLGSSAVFYLDTIESHIPERAQWRVSALNGRPSQTQSLDAKNRPAFLLEPAEPITVIAEVPDGPPARFTWRRVTRRVMRSEGPERIAPEWWRLIGRIQSVEADQPNPDGTLVTTKPTWRMRDYYRVEDEHGGAYWIYRAGLYPTASLNEATGETTDHAVAAPDWYLQGLF